MEKRFIRRIVILSLIGNVLLTTIKLTFGMLGNSESLISDGVNSFSDILVSILLLIVLRIAHKKADKDHPYGHEKFEGVAYFVLSLVILLTAILLAYSGIESLIERINNPANTLTPETFTIYVAILALIIKLILYGINKYTAGKFSSSSLKADAKNHLFDIFVTSISLTSIVLAQYGLFYIEAIATILISLFIFYAGVLMVREAISFLVDEAPDEDTVKAISQVIITRDGVIRIDDLKIRRHMNKYYVDVEIAVDKNLLLENAHKIAEDVHDAVEKKFDVLHCMVHVNPYQEKVSKNK